jgi:hypothetical protein
METQALPHPMISPQLIIGTLHCSAQPLQSGVHTGQQLSSGSGAVLLLQRCQGRTMEWVKSLGVVKKTKRELLSMFEPDGLGVAILRKHCGRSRHPIHPNHQRDRRDVHDGHGVDQ